MGLLLWRHPMNLQVVPKPSILWPHLACPFEPGIGLQMQHKFQTISSRQPPALQKMVISEAEQGLQNIRIYHRFQNVF
jgi:hypothetical protein